MSKERKTITIAGDVYRRIRRHRESRETLSATMRRIIPAATAEELAESLRRFEGIGAGPRRRPRVPR